MQERVEIDVAARRDRRWAEKGPAGADVADLHESFERLRRRHRRLSRLLRRRELGVEGLITGSRGRLSTEATRERSGYHEVWSRWSQSYDAVSSAADHLLRARARSLPEVIKMFSALEWLLLSDGVIVDLAVERQVRRFGRGVEAVGFRPTMTTRPRRPTDWVVSTALAMF